MLNDGIKSGRIKAPEGQPSTKNKRSTQFKVDKTFVSIIFPSQSSIVQFSPQLTYSPQVVMGQKVWLPKHKYIKEKKKWVFTPI